jgi:hypothetical protein
MIAPNTAQPCASTSRRFAPAATSEASIRRSLKWIAIVLLLLSGCGQPQVGADNARLVESLRTAISTRRTDWLDDTAKTVATRHDSGQLADKPYQALQAIIDQARAGQWEDAETAVLKLAKAQRAE